MTQMIDTEGDELPKNKDGRAYFNIDLCDFHEGNGPELFLNIPMMFNVEDGTGYCGCGVLTAPIQAVLEEYLQEFEGVDGGETIDKFVAWLRDYASRLEFASLARPQQTPGETQ